MQNVIWEGETRQGYYRIIDGPYEGREARVLYSGDHQAAQSGVPKDDNPDMLFDYNQRLFELATNVVPERMLLIGGGVLTLPMALLRALPHISIDVVELDPGLPELAEQFFGLVCDDRLRVYATDGRAFMRDHALRYDFIVVDAYENTTIPRSVKTLQAFEAYKNHLKEHGVLAMNVISGYHGPSGRTLKPIYAAATRTFDSVDVFLASDGYSLWLPQNFILVGQKGQILPLVDYIRYGAVSPSEASPRLILED
ncbi:MAG TPA: fused MFS/spermidine synthase [Verrucomicrobiae bacterium]|nr:fused MFS/spermidine synthase [Verrucomicrobiae bacterium]